jgi:SinI restriction endonuclease
MISTNEALAVAESEMAMIDISLVAPFLTLIRFLRDNPTLIPTVRGNVTIWSPQHISAMASKFFIGRTPNKPSPPATVPDPIVSFILNIYFDVPANGLERAKNEHKLAMAAENIVGDLLERFLANILEQNGWVWCAGSTVRSVDLIKPLSKPAEWFALQVKNRDNSENSSSSSVRQVTNIKKWFRTYSRTGETNWHNFPDEPMRQSMSEDKFQEFVKTYLKELKAIE